MSWYYDLDKVINTMREVCKQSASLPITLHGGESLAMPLEDVERIIAESYRLSGRSGIQTNGSLITEEHIELFKKYQTHVGISIDGDAELNEFRATKETTQKVLKIVERIKVEKIPVGLIVMVHQANAGTEERFEKLKEFVHKMESWKINGQLNPLGIPVGTQGMEEFGLSAERLTYVYKELAKLMLENGYRWSPFIDIWNSLQGKGRVSSIFKKCDPYHTEAIVILGDGTTINCLRNKSFLVHPHQIFRREELLQKIPMEYGGCNGCRFFSFCNGGCPGNGINGDWRNRDANCPAYKAMFEFTENVLKSQGISTQVQIAS